MSCARAQRQWKPDNRENEINAFGMDVRRRISAFKRHRDVFFRLIPIRFPARRPNGISFFSGRRRVRKEMCVFQRRRGGVKGIFEPRLELFILVDQGKCVDGRSPIPVRSRKQYQTRISPGCKGNLALALASRSRLDPSVFLEGEGGSGGWGSVIARARTRAPPSPRARPRVLRVPRAG